MSKLLKSCSKSNRKGNYAESIRKESRRETQGFPTRATLFRSYLFEIKKYVHFSCKYI